jgi:hypothetical protein
MLMPSQGYCTLLRGGEAVINQYRAMVEWLLIIENRRNSEVNLLQCHIVSMKPIWSHAILNMSLLGDKPSLNSFVVELPHQKWCFHQLRIMFSFSVPWHHPSNWPSHRIKRTITHSAVLVITNKSVWLFLDISRGHQVVTLARAIFTPGS